MEDYEKYFKNAYDKIHDNKRRFLQSAKDQNKYAISDEEIEIIKEKLRTSGELYQDPNFPPNFKSLYGTHNHNLGIHNTNNIQWLRPMYIKNDPQFISDGVTKFDIKQGQLGDCWFLASVALLAEHEDLFNQVVLPNQGFEADQYNGMFVFRFWQYGKWINIIVDDLLPTIYGGQLLFVSSTDPNEFWVALLEKAYAKLYGCYAAIVGGFIPEALQDLTGGICQTIQLHDERGRLKSTDFYKDLFLDLLESYEQGGLMGTVINGSGESETPLGLIRGHAYSITNVSVMKYKDRKVSMIRIRNPWGNHVEWKGRFHDNSAEWYDIETGDNIIVEHNPADGEYWMTFYDFLLNFDDITICNLYNTSTIQNTWELCQFYDEWVLHTTAGGAFNVNRTFYKNPQYAITLTADHNKTSHNSVNKNELLLNNFSNSSESLYESVLTNETDSNNGDHDTDSSNIVSLIISLMQLNNRAENVNVGCIGFAVFKVTDEDLQKNKPLPESFFRKYSEPDYFTNPYAYAREINLRLNLEPGNYIIVPTMFYNNTEGEFYLRVLSVDYDFKAIPHDNVMHTKLTDDIIINDNDNDNLIDNDSSIKVLDFINHNNFDGLTEYINSFVDEIRRKLNPNDENGDQKKPKKIVMCCGLKKNNRKKNNDQAEVTSSSDNILFKCSQSQIEAIFKNCTSADECANRLKLIKRIISKLCNIKDMSKFFNDASLRDIFSTVGYQVNNQFLNTIGKIYRKNFNDCNNNIFNYITYCTQLELLENSKW